MSSATEMTGWIVEAIAATGWCQVPDFMDTRAVDAIREEARGLFDRGLFRPAGIGRGQGLAQRPDIRGDTICWVDPATAGPAVRAYLERIEGLRSALNQALYLGLFDFEGHLATYPPGSRYRRHLDRFRGVELRTLSCILYLNEDWQAGEGGALRIYTDPQDPDRFHDVLPAGGTLATFLSERFEHEVMPASRERLSLTGWLKRRA